MVMKKLYFLILALLCLGIGAGKAQYTKLLDFGGTNNGDHPRYSNLTISGSALYGMTNSGGTNGDGNIFSININGNGYTDLYDFNGANGQSPAGSLTLSGTMFYGMTTDGGANNYGCIFSINLNGSGYTDLHDFSDTIPNGFWPNGSLTILDSVLYGMTWDGGRYNGTVFSINTNGSGYTDLLDFNYTNGYYPYGSLTLSGNVLYGMASHGGTGQGTIFSVNTNGSGYNDLLDFSNTNGYQPYGSLTLSGSVLYGMTNGGGANGLGCIFSINTNGNGYTDLLDFDSTNGANPTGDLTLSGNVLYGMAQSGGAYNNGCIFAINTNGSGYTDLHDFDGPNGANPGGSLTLSGSLLYGMTSSGGAYDGGVVFSYNTMATSINESTAPSEAISVYPNPNDGKFRIELSGVSGKSLFEVYNTLGGQVYKTTLKQINGSNIIDMGFRSNGVYFYQVVSENGDVIGLGKLIIQK
jgi:uncharacterized repeat protein (TIGR03803 family)